MVFDPNGIIEFDSNGIFILETNGIIVFDSNGIIELDSNGIEYTSKLELVMMYIIRKRIIFIFNTNGIIVFDLNGITELDSNGIIELDSNGIIELDSNDIEFTSKLELVMMYIRKGIIFYTNGIIPELISSRIGSKVCNCMRLAKIRIMKSNFGFSILFGQGLTTANIYESVMHIYDEHDLYTGMKRPMGVCRLKGLYQQ